MPRWLKFLILALLLLIVGAIPLAMLQSGTGAIEGFVTDAFGPVGSALIGAHNTTSGMVAHAQSRPDGYYRIERLQPGRYSLWIVARGHDSVWIARVDVTRDHVSRADVDLRLIVTEASR
jgi:hypothetical protein